MDDVFETNFRTLVKNVNTKVKILILIKIKPIKLSNFLLDISLPLKKTEEKFTKFLNPKLSLRHSPNKTKNIQNLDRQLNIDNIFSLNRIGTNDEIESGTSLAVGNEFLIKNENQSDIFLLILEQFLEEENKICPLCLLRNSQSDIVGGLSFSGLENWKINYDFSADNNLNTINLHRVSNTFNVNNFIHTFEFYEENNSLGDNSYYLILYLIRQTK